MFSSQIIGVGSYLPQKILSNYDLTKIVETSDSWITERTGIKKRHIAGENELTSDLAARALKAALKSANIEVDTLDGIIVATSTSDLIFPSTAVSVQHKIGMSKGFAFDINAVCSGFVYALSVGDAMIKSAQAKRIAVVGAETFSRIVDWKDRSTCVLFGDGAGAVVLEAKPQSNKNGIIGIELRSDGSLVDILKVNGGPSKGKLDAKIEMNGREVYRNAVEKMSEISLELLQKHGYKITDVNWILPHQANIRIIYSLAERLGISHDKIISTVHEHANTSAASIPLALDTYLKAGKIRPGELILMSAVGAGLTWGSALIFI